MATVLGAIDLGYRVILIEDAVCSGDDQTHEASLELLRNRFSVQLELMTADNFLRQAYGRASPSPHNTLGLYSTAPRSFIFSS
jgi:hypothetical protein